MQHDTRYNNNMKQIYNITLSRRQVEDNPLIQRFTQSPSRTATTWYLPRTIPVCAKDAFVLLMAAAPCDFWCYGAVCEYNCTYLLI